MLKKLLMGGLAAGAMAVPLAGAAWADPMPTPNPPPMPNPSGQNPANTYPGAVPESNPAMPAVAGPNEQGPSCVVSANAPSPTVNNPAQGTQGTTWVQVATLDGSVASELGLPPAPVQMMKVFCAPVGSQTGAAEQPTGLANPGQTNPAQNPVNPVQNQPGQTGPQNPMPGQQ